MSSRRSKDLFGEGAIEAVPLAPALLRSATRAGRAGVDTATTLGFRLPILFGAPGVASMVEWQVAAFEKAMAIASGMTAAGLRLQRLGLKAANGSMGGLKLAEEWLAVVDEATDPAFRRVGANARRLRRRS